MPGSSWAEAVARAEAARAEKAKAEAAAQADAVFKVSKAKEAAAKASAKATGGRDRADVRSDDTRFEAGLGGKASAYRAQPVKIVKPKEFLGWHTNSGAANGIRLPTRVRRTATARVPNSNVQNSKHALTLGAALNLSESRMRVRRPGRTRSTMRGG